MLSSPYCPQWGTGLHAEDADVDLHHHILSDDFRCPVVASLESKFDFFTGKGYHETLLQAYALKTLEFLGFT